MVASVTDRRAGQFKAIRAKRGGVGNLGITYVGVIAWIFLCPVPKPETTCNNTPSQETSVSLKAQIRKAAELLRRFTSIA